MRRVKVASEKVLSKVVDVSLFTLFFGIGFSGSGVSNRGVKTEKAVEEMFGQVNYESIKRSYRYLAKKGLIEYIKERGTLPKITEEGRRRLKNILPIYNKTRTWDERIYLVIYDIPKENNKIRNYLRKYLMKIGCGMLQASVWLTPYNPKKLVEEFINKYSLESDAVIVSSIGKDGTIGELELSDLVVKVYKLESLNARYQEFINNKDPMQFLATLKDDPQLPFDLLPDWWVGDEANKVFEKLIV